MAATGLVAYKLAKNKKKRYVADRPASPIYYMHYFFLARPTPCCLLLVAKQHNTTKLDRLLAPWLPHVYQAVRILRWSQIKKLSVRLASFYYSPEVTGRGSQPSKSWRLQQRWLRSRPRSGSRSRQSGRSICLLQTHTTAGI